MLSSNAGIQTFVPSGATFRPEDWGNLMIIELNEEEARLLYAIVLEKAQEHFSYASASEIADRLCKLAARFSRRSRDVAAVIHS